MTTNSKKIVVLTGAGISAESGIKTFRDAGGLWENHRVEDVATPEAFAADPELVQNFYNMRRKSLLDPKIQPNPAHKALSLLEKAPGKELFLVTQNIDNLHELAGSTNVLHMHGELLKMHCTSSKQVFPISSDITTSDLCDCCSKGGTLRPHIIWFGEVPFEMDHIIQKLEECDLFISIGTSAQVYPAAQFVQIAKNFGAHCVEINLETTEKSSSFDQTIHGKATVEVPKFIQQLLQGS